ncbi:hypothetical protein DSM3645_03663 [Blastopirellula marina DSM 3645]|uniref:Uncharacterized protein n=1 Tax=Blastopirellula marina DSM 3645 TaxID=314230 RepID=A3ZW44_9BACT|nr:hypothetical protein DSM3645_03663 [Blastopirellula marina DSM 3645]
MCGEVRNSENGGKRRQFAHASAYRITALNT